MKNIYKISQAFSFALVLAICTMSCDDKHDFNNNDSAIDANAAKLKFVHTAVGASGTNFTVNFSVDNKKVSAINVATGLPLGVGIGTTYPSPLNYALVSSGSQSMSVVIPARAAVATTTTAPGIPAFTETPVLTAPLVTEAGKNYTSFLVGFAPTYAIHTVNDDFSMVNPSSANAFVRYINLITNTPAAGYEVVISKTSPVPTVVLQTFSSIGYLGGNPAFVPIPTILDTESTPYTVQLRVTGTTVVVASIANFVPRPGRTYTLFSRGRVGGLSNGAPSTTVNIPVLTFYTNR
ncbi:MAG: hypothetical protein RLZZ312_1152 [Bacteroidota bacterium]|jgi:hypothetical protein